MYLRKIAIYVEGQTEQILLKHLILTWYCYAGIKIETIKLRGYQKVPCTVLPFEPLDANPESLIFFVIIDIDGIGSLVSAIADRVKKQREANFDIIALRDLHADDYLSSWNNQKRSGARLSKLDIIQKITKQTRLALQQRGCEDSDKIGLYFAIMDVECWLLTFTTAVAKWANISESEVLQVITGDEEQARHFNFEMIDNSATCMKRIAELGGKKYDKSHGTTKLLVDHITCEEIDNVYKSNQNPSFSIFWNNLLCLSQI